MTANIAVVLKAGAEMEEDCVFCETYLSESQTATLTAKGCDGIRRASTERGVDIRVQPGQKVHQSCRRAFCNPNNITADTRKRTYEQSSMSRQNVLRSETPTFCFREHCFFCGFPGREDHRRKNKNQPLIKVRTTEFTEEINRTCDRRGDKWSEVVKGRLNIVSDLFAADAVYHQVCSVNFRTDKAIPLMFSSENQAPKKGRQESAVQAEAFRQVAKHLEEIDGELVTINQLIEKMEEFIGESDETAYHFTYMKEKLKMHFGNRIVISEVNGKQNVVTLHSTASSILHDFYKQPKEQNCVDEEKRIIETAAKLIKTDIQGIVQSKDVYASCEEISSTENALSFIPDSLCLLLKVLFSNHDETKLVSIGQAIMQASRPRGILAPLQVGLGVQLHHHFASKFLIESLHKHGFCCSYSEVMKFSMNAAVSQGIDIPGFTSGHFMQYVADNVDHNIRTIDGMNTFHGMGMITTATPSIPNNRKVPRLNVSPSDLSDIGTVNITNFFPDVAKTRAMAYNELQAFGVEDPSPKLDYLWKLSYSLKPKAPNWSGLMQLLHEGNYPGKSSVFFLPMIDMDPGNMSCIFSTLRFISDHAQRHGVKPIVTFDQPLWWKATQIIESQSEESTLKSIVLRLGGFHTIMSFVGSIGHIMSGTGLEELLETVYAKNTVPHMLNGKAIQRAIRGLLLVDVSLNTLLISEEYEIIAPCVASRELTKELSEVTTENNNDDDLTSIIKELSSTQTSDNNITPSTADLTDPNAVSILYDDLLEGKKTTADVASCQELTNVISKLEAIKALKQSSRTANMWMQFMDMMDILRRFIKAERSGNWNLHLQSMFEMLPYLAASGHNLYTKSVYIYLQKMAPAPSTQQPTTCSLQLAASSHQ